MSMRRSLSILFIALSLAVGSAGVAHAAGTVVGTATEGQSCDPTDSTDGGTAVCETGLICATDSGNNTCQKPTSEAAKKAAAEKQTEDDRKKSADWGYGYVMQMILKLFSWLVGVAALTLNYAMYYTVIDMGRYISNLSAIKVVWEIMRDIGNILLIFGFLAIGISIIIDSDWYGGGKKLLPTLLIAAVFTNFSLFAAEAVIDVSNLFATQFYKQINGGKLDADTLKKEQISSIIMNKIGLQTTYGGGGDANAEIFKTGNQWIVGFMGVLLFIITAFVMFALAFILIARFIYLLYLIVVSPIGIAGLAVPYLSKYAHQWWNDLFKQAITAPVLLLLLYIALQVINDDYFLAGFGYTADIAKGGWAGAAAAATNATGPSSLIGLASLMLSFIIAMGLLLAVVIVAKNLSAFGASWATKKAGAASFGLTAWGMNRSIGRISYRAARGLRQSKTFNKFDALTGRATTRVLDRAAKGTFDVRGTKAWGSTEIKAGEPAKDGFVGARKRTIETHEAAVKAIDTAFKEAKQSKDQRNAADAHWETQKNKNQAQETQKRAQETLDLLRKNGANQENIKKAEENLVKATENLETATTAEKEARTARENADKEAGARRSFKLKESTAAYAEGISHTLNPIGFVAYGSGTGDAARKIKASLKDKSKKDRAYEDMKKAFLESDEGVEATAEKQKKNETGSEQKPAVEEKPKS